MKNILLPVLLILAACRFNGNDKQKQETSPVTNDTVSLRETGNVSKQSPFVIKEIDTLMHFENVQTGILPPGWQMFTTGKDTHTEWKVLDDNGNKVLAQVSAPHPNYHFNGAVYEPFMMKNGYLEVKFKAVSGRKDQGGGLVWRYRNADNYYIVRANPLENNVVLYKVIDGKRSDLPLVGKGKTYGVKTPPLGKKWHTLAVRVEGDLFTVYLDGKELFRVRNNEISGAGKTGLWTKADAVTYFDDFLIQSKGE